MVEISKKGLLREDKKIGCLRGRTTKVRVLKCLENADIFFVKYKFEN